MQTYEDLINKYLSNFKSIMNAIEKMKSDKDIKLLLENILAIGNYMNGTSARGGAYGFKIDILS